MSTLGHTLTPAVSRLYTREEHRQYQYVTTSGTGYVHNWEDPSKLIQHAGGRHAEILTPTSWVAPFRGKVANADWYAVDELSLHSTNFYTGVYPFGSHGSTADYTSPGRTTYNGTAGTVDSFPLTPVSFGTAAGSECWVMRKGTLAVDYSAYVAGPIGFAGTWTLSIYALAYRDYTLYSAWRRQLIHSSTFTGDHVTSSPYTVGSPLEIVLRHNSLWDISMSLSPDSGFANLAETYYEFNCHAIRTAP
jgi:hypothetical protein